MGNFARKYTTEQTKEACRLVNDIGLSAQQTHDRLLEGSNGLEPFTMPIETIRRYSRDDRQKRRPPPRPGHEIQDLTQRCITLAHEELAALETLSKQGDRDLNKLAKIVSTLTDLDKLRKANPTKKPSDTKTPLQQLDPKTTQTTKTHTPNPTQPTPPTQTTDQHEDEPRDAASGVLGLASTLDRAA